ncbi:MAG: 50S ribosomal protein L3 N(5)-glutamine methyltransferase [Pseudomonadota bacterium]
MATLDTVAAVRDLATVRDFLRWGMTAMNRAGVHLGHGTDDAWDEALALVLHALALPHDADPRILDARLTQAEREQVAELVRQRVEERVPVAYLTGIAWFAGLPFRVDSRVLIPRSPIAELIADRFEPWLDADRVQRVLELCTGSGCIAIACGVAFPDADITATDLSADALAVARENRVRHGMETQLTLVEGDLYAGVPGRFDLIVTNPPYVDAADMAALPPEYRHEPALGLAAGADGLDLVVRILAGAGERLTDHGLLVCEVGNSDAALLDLFPQVPFVWPEGEGEGGVFVLAAADVRAHTAAFRAEAARRV